ncbi:hypothetical protein F7734_09835 [Scytonema sp. UIC 10036]|uniref:hypothetical protein n=1 Tax=Scytonema sp. UIC 10036 TaxID=2304196 RepID=UPI0012DA510E|nr:hypothetical protein [Scytonema sp. UIC 10036]MUG92733.1 hypothetical protein [Scytonema sp. UIC 10036]
MTTELVFQTFPRLRSQFSSFFVLAIVNQEEEDKSSPKVEVLVPQNFYKIQLL